MLGRQFFDRPVSFLGALLYQYLPISAQHLSDGISEPAFLLFLVSGLLQAVHAMRGRQRLALPLCGYVAGLAYLIRPEGAMILPAFGIVLIGDAISLGVAHALDASFLLRDGDAAGRGFHRRVLCRRHAGASRPRSAPSKFSIIFGIWWPGYSAVVKVRWRWPAIRHFSPRLLRRSTTRRFACRAACGRLVSEINQGFHYVAGVPAFLGLCWSFGGMRRDAGFWLLAVFGLLHSFILVSLAMSVYYVSERHVTILVLLGCFFTVAACELPRRVLAWFRIEQAATWFRSAPLWFTVLLVALLAPACRKRRNGCTAIARRITQRGNGWQRGLPRRKTSSSATITPGRISFPA